MKRSSDLPDLLQKFIANRASTEEVQALFQLIQTHPEAKQTIAQVMDQELASESFARELQKGTDWEDMPFDPAISKQMLQTILSRIQVPGPEVTIAERRLEGRDRWKNQLWKGAAVVVLTLGLGFVAFQQGFFSSNNHIHYLTQVTGKGQTALVRMPDGSVIRMNSHSKIEYPEHFANHAQREIRLEGEAFFEVAKDPEKPFVITTRQGIVRVLGTAFNVKENQHDTTLIVAVREGRVAFASLTDPIHQKTVLGTGEVGLLNRSTLSQSHTQALTNYLSWYNGRLVFKNAPLPEVVQQLSQIYDTPIRIENPELTTLRFTATMKREALPQILEQLALSLNIRFEHTGRTIILYRK